MDGATLLLLFSRLLCRAAVADNEEEDATTVEQRNVCSRRNFGPQYNSGRINIEMNML